MNRTFDPGVGLSVLCDQLNTGGNVWAALKAPCKAATTANINLTGRQTIDGVALIDGDRVLVKDQTLGVQNGIYLVSTFGSWNRAQDWDDNFDVLAGTLVYITNGTTNGGLHYTVSTADNITVGVTSVAFAIAFSAAAASFTQSGTGASSRTVQEKVREIEVTPQDFGVTVSDAGAGFRAAIAAISANGGGVLRVPLGTYTFSVAAEADCLLVDFDSFKLLADPGTVFKWSYYGLPLIPIIGADNVEISGVHFQWTGTRGASPSSTNHFGYDGTGVASNPDWCCHIFVGGSTNVDIHDVSWDGATTASNLEVGIYFYNGTATGPTSATADVSGNKLRNFSSNDVYFGAAFYGQKDFEISNGWSDRYIAATAYVGPGHFIYGQYLTDGVVRNLNDKGTAIDSITTAASNSYKFVSLTNVTIKSLAGRRLPGLGGVTGNCNGCRIEDLSWEGDRVADETNLANSTVWTIGQSDTTSTINRNAFTNWTFIDKKNSGSARSGNCPILTTTSTFRANLADTNFWSGIKIFYAPDGSYGKSVCDVIGVNSMFDVTVINDGSADKVQFTIKGDDTTRKAQNNIARVRLAGTRTLPRIGSTNGTSNLIFLDTNSTSSNNGTLSSGDTIVMGWSVTGRSKFSTVPIGSVAYSSMGTNTTPVAGTIYWAEVFIPRSMTITGIGVLNGGTVGTNKYVVGLYDSDGGAVVANSATAGTLSSGANAFQQIAFTATYNAIGPQRYWIAVQLDGTTDTFRTIAASTFVDVLTKSVTGSFGTLSSLTVPTTFTADAGPIAYVY